MNQSAIAMLQKTIELMTKETCTELMSEMIPPLLTVSLNRRMNSFIFECLFALIFFFLFLVVG